MCVVGELGYCELRIFLELFNIKTFLPLSSVPCVIMGLYVVFTFYFRSQVEYWNRNVFDSGILGASIGWVLKNTPMRCLYSLLCRGAVFAHRDSGFVCVKGIARL